MSNAASKLNLIQLRKSLQQAALPADRQIARLQGFDVAFEVADDFDNWCRWALNSADTQLTDEQRSLLIELNNRLNQMSGEHNSDLWTDDALRSRNEWDEVRREARCILDSFSWPIEDAEKSEIEVVRVNPSSNT
jgi:hypothetical protein